MSLAIIAAIAERESCKPCDITPPLYEVINPEALDALFRTNTGRVCFIYRGYIVSVDAERQVDLTPIT